MAHSKYSSRRSNAGTPKICKPPPPPFIPPPPPPPPPPCICWINPNPATCLIWNNVNIELFCSYGGVPDNDPYTVVWHLPGGFEWLPEPEPRNNHQYAEGILFNLNPEPGGPYDVDVEIRWSNSHVCHIGWQILDS
jgi:hypothetical protein